MSLTRIAATGRGRISARLVIEGLEHVFVSDRRMERTMSDGRVCVCGLDTASLTIGASADMMTAKLRGTGMTARIRDMDRIPGHRHGRVTRGLWRSPTVRGFLAADTSKTATTITLRDASSFPASGVVHIGTEAIAYTGKSSTQLTGCTRGHWQTIAQAHYVADGEGLADALVTDQPIGLEGRRAYLYLYGDGPTSVAQGDGSLRWRGICATDVTWSEGVCEIAIDPISRLLDQPIGGDAGGSIGIRGIHYTSASPWGLEIHDLSALSEKIARVRMVGFYADQATFNAATNPAIDSALAAASISLGTGSSLRLVELPGVGYFIEYTTATASPVPITVVVRSDMPGETLDGAIDTWQDATGRHVTTMFDRTWAPDVTTRYSIPVMRVSFPRATIGRGGWSAGESEPPSTTATYYTLYLGGLQMPTAGSGLTMAGFEDLRPMTISSTLPAVRAVYLTGGTIPSRLIVLDGRAEIRIGRLIATGSVLDLAAQLVVDSPSQANTGSMPLIAAGEIGWTGDLDDAVTAQPLAQGRGFVSFEDAFTLGEFVTPELLVLGAYQRIALDGSLEWARLSQALSTDATAWTIDDSAGARPRIERGPRGVLGQVLYRLEYDPREDEWARAITFRDVQSASATRTPITLEIAQRSTSSGTLRAGDEWSRIDRSVLARAAMGAFGIFGVPVVVIEVATDARYMDARIGDVVQLSSSLLPDPETGYTAIAGRAGVIVGHQLECRTGAVSLSIMVSTQRVVGYAPEFLIASSSPVSGTTWDITVTLGTGYTQSTDVADWLAAGDLVRVLQGNSTTPTEVLGTVDSLQSATVVRVTLAGAWVPGSSEWTLRTRNAGDYAVAARLAGFAFNAGTDARLSYSGGDVDAKVFS